MSILENISLQDLTGLNTDMIILGLAILVIILLIITIVNGVSNAKMRKAYKKFMQGRAGISLENILFSRLDKMEEVIEENEKSREKIDDVAKHMDNTYQKVGLVKYNAFDDLGGKLSFSLCLLNRKNNGFIINAMHSREGCFTYLKEVIDGNAVLMLADEEKEALEIAKNDK